MKKVCLAFGFVMTSLSIFAQTGTHFLDNLPWTEVVQQAKQENKPVFVDCYTTWCGPCRQLATEVFPQEQVGEYFNQRFICVKYDVEKGEGLAFAEQYPDLIHSYPTLLVIGADGRVIHKVAGSRPAEELIAAVDAGLGGNTIYTLKPEFDAGNREWDFICPYLDLLDIAGEDKQYEAVARAYASQFPIDSLLNPDIWRILWRFVVKEPYGEEFRFVVSHLENLQARGLIDRYALEQKLSQEMVFAVNGVRLAASQIKNQDTLAIWMGRVEQLHALLEYPVKGFPESMATLEVLEGRIRQDVDAVYERFRVLVDCHLITDNLFQSEVLKYLVAHVEDREQLQFCIDYALDLKGKASKAGWIQEGFDDAIAQGRERLKTITE